MKYIIFDLDDTLLNDNRQVSPYTQQVLKRLQAMGHILAINTARSRAFSQEYIDIIGPDYAILNGGALILNRAGETVFQAEIDAETTRAVIAELLEMTDNISVQTADSFYSHMGYYKGQNAKEIDFSREYFGFSAQKIIASLEEEQKVAAVAEKFSLQYTTYFSGTFRRFSHRNATKALGNRNLVELLGGDLQDVIAFGDDWGDMQMLREAGVGVLMKNAKPHLHEEGLHLSEYTNDEDGVARFLIKYFTLPEEKEE